MREKKKSMITIKKLRENNLPMFSTNLRMNELAALILELKQKRSFHVEELKGRRLDYLPYKIYH